VVAERFTFDAALWEYQGEAPWYFVTLPTDIADDIAELALPRRGFGSVKVDVTVGATAWSTSLFPDKRAGSYLLPIKKAVRTAQSLDVGDTATFSIEVVDR
jgi:hypothetical protein